jgi:hypothetical protein
MALSNQPAALQVEDEAPTRFQGAEPAPEGDWPVHTLPGDPELFGPGDIEAIRS